jgi:multiple sugar transport system substrate-binding protein
MRKFTLRTATILLSATMMTTLTACGGAASTGKSASTAAVAEDKMTTEPVSLVFSKGNIGFSEDEFQSLIAGPVKAKYPNVSMTMVTNPIEDQVSKGEVPDIAATSNAAVAIYLELNLTQDLNPFVKKYNIDLGQINQETIKGIKQFGKNGELIGVPLDMNYGLMLYNKDIFDKFAVGYPTDKMTWDQVIDLAKKATRLQDGVQFIGVDTGNAQSMIRQYSLDVIDPKSGKAVINSDGYKKVFSIMKKNYEIPGYIGPKGEFAYGNNAFFKDGRMAMNPGWINGFTPQLIDLEKTGKAFNWDVVTYPAYSDRPNLEKQVDFHFLMVPPTGKHQDVAYRVLQLLLTQDFQTAMNKSSVRMSILNKPDILKNKPDILKDYTKDLKVYDGKNLAGIFKATPAPVPPGTIYDNKIYKILNDAQKDMAQKGTDINTVLRQADEAANKAIEEVNSGVK